MQLGMFRLRSALVGCAFVVWMSSLASAQWDVRMLQLDSDVSSTTQAYINILIPQQIRSSLLSDRSATFAGIDFAGGGGTYTLNNPYPGGISGDDLTNSVLLATADVDIPAGDWSIAFGSDEGGFLEIGDIEFSSRFNADDSFGNQIRSESNREFAWTGGHFTVGEAGLSTAITALMYENQGSDAWEIAIRNNTDASNSDNPNPLNGWQLLGNGIQGWSVTSEVTPPTVWVAGKDLQGTQDFANVQEPTRANEMVTAGGEVTSGLVHQWYDGTVTDRESALEVFENQTPSVPAFTPTNLSSFWSGTSVPFTGLDRYPNEIVDQPRGESTWNDTDNDNYVARLTGEILIEESGDYRFRDGGSDYVYLAIDIDGNGTIEPGETLIDDADPAPLNGNGASNVTATFEVEEGGSWRQIEFVVSDAAEADSAALYWDFDKFDTDFDGVRIGDGGGFPNSDGAPINTVFFGESLLVPNVNLRGAIPGELSSADLIAEVRNRWVFDVDVSGETGDLLQVANPDGDIFSTFADVEGAEFVLNSTDLSEDDIDKSIKIVDADTITGVPNLVGSDPSHIWQWVAETGSVQFVGFAQTAACGDTDSDGDIDAADRTTVTVNWTGAQAPGTGGKTHEDGDCDGDGDVDAADLTGLTQGWTGALGAGNTTDGDDADLIYDPATGNVTLDASDTGSGLLISFVIGTDENDLQTDGFQAPFIDAGTNTDNTPFQIGQTDPLNQGAGPLVDLGNILPAGISSIEELSGYLTLAEYASELGAGGTLDLRIVPEPSTLALAIWLPLVMLRRKRS